MAYLSSMAKESRSNLLVRDLEESRGCTLQITGRRTGFNGLSVYKGAVVRKIELKTVDRSDDWFAINGVYGIESLFFDVGTFSAWRSTIIGVRSVANARRQR